MVRILCVLFVAAVLTVAGLVPTAAARGCYVESQSRYVLCSEAGTGLAGSQWIWVFAAGWASMVALLLLTERCARRREREFPGQSRLASFRQAS